MQKGKNGTGQKSETHSRSRYSAHSKMFLEWVNALGIEKTPIGRFARDMDRRFHLNRIALIFLGCLVLAFMLLAEVDVVYTGYQLGDVVRADIKSPVSFDIPDEMATAEKRLQAELLVPPIYDLDLSIYENLTNNTFRSFREMRKILGKGGWPKGENARAEAIKDFSRHKKVFEDLLGVGEVSERGFEWLTEKRFNARIENAFIALFENLGRRRIGQDVHSLKARGTEKVVVRVVDKNNSGEEFAVPVSDLQDIGETRKTALEHPSIERLKFDQTDKARFRSLMSRLIAPNLTLNRQETAIRQKEVRDAVLPVMISVKKNQVVIREGAVVQPVHLLVLEEIEERQLQKSRDIVVLVVAALLLAIILVYNSYLKRFTLNRVKIERRDFMAMGLVTLLVAGIAKIFLFISTAAFQERFGMIPMTAYSYLVPFAAGPMLVGLLISYGEVIWLFTAFLAVAISITVDASYGFLVVSLIGGIAAARGVHGCKKRNDIYIAGLRTGLVNMLVIALVTVVEVDQRGELMRHLLWNVPAGLLAGFISSLIAMMLVPLLESVFNYTTDVKLLELSNLNHPLLKEMIVKAPGTYHHSLVVGNMVEAAAEAIGANPLLAKVSAYYHDIGKTEHASYFIENQRGGYNPHDDISPNMSKTVLIAHVKDGVELGHKYKLGKPIIDVVIQHHGTTLISFFYHKAKQSEDPSLYEVEEDDFRYPGPKPQIKESALCMLADSIEAAARCLDEPHPMRLQNIVKNIIHSKFMDGQLDECDLTLKDLSIIERSFNRILLGIYHQRIDYPTGKKPQGGSGKPSVIA